MTPAIILFKVKYVKIIEDSTSSCGLKHQFTDLKEIIFTLSVGNTAENTFYEIQSISVITNTGQMMH